LFCLFGLFGSPEKPDGPDDSELRTQHSELPIPPVTPFPLVSLFSRVSNSALRTTDLPPLPPESILIASESNAIQFRIAYSDYERQPSQRRTKYSHKSAEKHLEASNRISWHVDCCYARSERFHVSNHREVHDETEFCSTFNRHSVGIIHVRVRCEPCCPDRQDKAVWPHPDGGNNERNSERTSHTSNERANSL
jgi:hypothetical protein